MINTNVKKIPIVITSGIDLWQTSSTNIWIKLKLINEQKHISNQSPLKRHAISVMIDWRMNQEFFFSWQSYCRCTTDRNTYFFANVFIYMNKNMNGKHLLNFIEFNRIQNNNWLYAIIHPPTHTHIHLYICFILTNILFELEIYL